MYAFKAKFTQRLKRWGVVIALELGNASFDWEIA
jgi:hypothetical protein